MSGVMEDSGGCQQKRPTSMEGLPKCATDGEEDCLYLGENAPQKEGGALHLPMLQPFESPLLRQDGAITPSIKGRIYHIRDERVQALRAKVQVPKEGAFDKKDLKWEATQNNGRGQMRNTFQAIIPWNRLWDFVEGESTNYDFPCKFLKVPSKCVQKPGQAENPRDSSALQKIRFHCEYGPEDKTIKVKDDVGKIFSKHLKERLSTNEKSASNGVVKEVVEAAKDASKTTHEIISSEKAIEIVAPPIAPSSSPKSLIQRRTSRVQAGKSKKRGCLCEFDAKQLYLDSTLCTIQFHCFDHVNEQGQPCHGRSFANKWEGNGEVGNYASRQSHLMSAPEKLLQNISVVLSDIEKLVRGNNNIRAIALADLTAVQEKLINHQALASTGLPHPTSQPSFAPSECDNQAQRIKGSSHKRRDKKRARVEQ